MKISELTIKQFKTNLKLFSNQKYLTSTKEEIICQVDEYEKPLLSQFARELFNFDTDYHNLNNKISPHHCSHCGSQSTRITEIKKEGQLILFTIKCDDCLKNESRGLPEEKFISILMLSG